VAVREPRAADHARVCHLDDRKFPAFGALVSRPLAREPTERRFLGERERQTLDLGDVAIAAPLERCQVRLLPGTEEDSAVVSGGSG
jgi:hypothetical protein